MPAARLSIICASYVNRYEHVQGEGIEAHRVTAKLNKFEYSWVWGGVPCTVRSKMKKFEHVGGGGATKLWGGGLGWDPIWWTERQD